MPVSARTVQFWGDSAGLPIGMKLQVCAANIDRTMNFWNVQRELIEVSGCPGFVPAALSVTVANPPDPGAESTFWRLHFCGLIQISNQPLLHALKPLAHQPVTKLTAAPAPNYKRPSLPS